MSKLKETTLNSVRIHFAEMLQEIADDIGCKRTDLEGEFIIKLHDDSFGIHEAAPYK